MKLIKTQTRASKFSILVEFLHSSFYVDCEDVGEWGEDDT